MNNRIVKLMLIATSFLILVGCEYSVKPSPIIIKIADKDLPKYYPADVTYNYKIIDDAKNIYGEDVFITFKFITGRHSAFHIYPVLKTDDGYIIIGADVAEEPFEDITKLNYAEPIQLKEQAGQFSVKVDSEYKAKLLDSDYIQGLTKFCMYNKCYDNDKFVIF